MNSIQLIRQALDLYNSGQLQQARTILIRLTRRIDITEENIEEKVSESLSSPSAAAEGWIDLAIDKIDRDLGAANFALVPVNMALKTAIDILS